MKSLFTFIIFSMSLSAVAQSAQPVELVGKEVSIDAAEAVVARTSKTAKEVAITLSIPMQKTVCENYETHTEWRTSAIHCGEDVHYDRRTVKVCDERNDKGECVRGHTEERTERIAVARSCMVPVTVCTQYGTATITKRDNMTIEFKKLPALAGSEADLFRVKGFQKQFDGDGVKYEVEVIQSVVPLKVKREGRLFGKSEDDFVVTVK